MVPSPDAGITRQSADVSTDPGNRTRCWFDVGPASKTLALHQTNHGPTSRVTFTIILIIIILDAAGVLFSIGGRTEAYLLRSTFKPLNEII